jgi:NADH:ubiquinone oxidoreductase subunit
MTLMMRLVTSLTGQLVGKDAVGNIYYQAKSTRAGVRRRRWVMYKGEVEASTIPPEWHAWLHYTTDLPIPETVRRAWQKPHEPNLTGTPLGYRPPGSDYLGGHRAPATGDYEAWTPGS